MSLTEIVEVINNMNIVLVNAALMNKLAFAFNDNGNNAIIYDKERCVDSYTEKTVLAEEIGHIENDALCFVYDYTNPCFRSNVMRAEAIAMQAAFNRLIPLDQLLDLLPNITYIWEISDYFEVSVDFAEKAIAYYKNNGKIPMEIAVE